MRPGMAAILPALRSSWSSNSKKPRLTNWWFSIRANASAKRASAWLSAKSGSMCRKLVAPSHTLHARRGEPRGFVVAGQAAVEGGDQIMALDLRERLDVMLPGVGEPAQRVPLVEPFQFPTPPTEDASP